MPKALSQFRTGQKVKMTCYHEGCEGVSIEVLLAEEFEVCPSCFALGGLGRIHWQPNQKVRGFHLANVGHHCPNPKCQVRFFNAIIVWRGRHKKPVIFGYEAGGMS